MRSTRSAAIRAAICALVTGFAACTDIPAADAPLSDEGVSAGQEASAGQAAPTDEPWFGVMLPPGFEPHALQVISARPAAPAVVPEGEGRYQALAGAAIQADLETIVGFSRESEESREVGEGQGTCFGKPCGGSMICGPDPVFRRMPTCGNVRSARRWGHGMDRRDVPHKNLKYRNRIFNSTSWRPYGSLPICLDNRLRRPRSSAPCLSFHQISL